MRMGKHYTLYEKPFNKFMECVRTPAVNVINVTPIVCYIFLCFLEPIFPFISLLARLFICLRTRVIGPSILFKAIYFDRPGKRKMNK